MKLWDVLAGEELRTFSGHTDIVNSLAFSSDGKMLASGSDDKTVKFWEAATGELRTLREVGRPVYSVAFSPRGNILALARAGGKVMLGVGAPGGELRPLLGHVGPVLSLAFSPDGKTLASAGADQTIKLREVATGRELFTLAGHADYVLVVAFSPDGRTLASGSRDGTLRLWDVATGAEVVTIGPLRRWPAASFKDVSGVVFGPHGRKLACAVGSEILIYDLHAYDEEIERWLKEAGVRLDPSASLSTGSSTGSPP